MIEIKEHGHYVAIWFAGDGRTMDWLGILEREPSGEHVLRYRFRYYHPESKDPFDDKDAKSGVWVATFKPEHDERAVCAIVEGLVDTVAEVYGTITRHKLEVNGDGRRFAEVLSAAPFAHQSTAEGLDATPTSIPPEGTH